MEKTVENTLNSLFKLQEIDSKLDKIIKVRGALPDEVNDLEDEVAGYQTRVEKHIAELEECKSDISTKKNEIKDSEKLIKKYEEQQMNVRNNREYDAITKEMELQTLEIEFSEKKIKEASGNIESKKEGVESAKLLLKEREKDLESKKGELGVLTAESEEEEAKLVKNKVKANKKVDERLLHSYEKIRGNARNGLAVVQVKRGACGGCFNIVPPQRQADIREKKKIIVCEHCGRIFSDVDPLPVVEEKPKRTTRRKKA